VSSFPDEKEQGEKRDFGEQIAKAIRRIFWRVEKSMLLIPGGLRRFLFVGFGD
jgi:hypothetical protein